MTFITTTTAAASDLLAVDLETDGEGGNGLCGTAPGAVVTDVGVATSGGAAAITGGTEQDRLRRLSDVLTLFTGTVVTWWGSGFDWPYLMDRYAAHGMPLPFVVTASRDGRPSDHHPAPVIVNVAGHGNRWRHVDACTAWRPVRKAQGLSGSLKAVARDHGMDPIEVDRSRMADLSDAERIAYVKSDAIVTHKLAVGLGDILYTYRDRPWHPSMG
jgi:DNA polymerase elongation subunit (family B)